MTRVELLEAIGQLSGAEKRALLGNQPLASTGGVKMTPFLTSLTSEEKAALVEDLKICIKGGHEGDALKHLQVHQPDATVLFMANNAYRGKSFFHSVNVALNWLTVNA